MLTLSSKPMLPHSLLFGHLPIMNDFLKSHPPDVNIYVFHSWLHSKRREYFPGLEIMPPVVYLDLWPATFSMALIYDAAVATQFTQTKSALKHRETAAFLAPMTSNLDIITAENTSWKALHQIFRPAFSQQNIMAIVPDLLDEMAVFANILGSLCGENGTWGRVFALEEKTVNLTFDIICRSLL